VAETVVYKATGRRKTAVARVRMMPGQGRIFINNHEVSEHSHCKEFEIYGRQPMILTDTSSKYDIYANVDGGGFAGQAIALRHGVSRALIIADSNLRLVLKRAGYLIRDSRKKERKKYGQPGARKRFQYSKR
jgi:small subunit ribosomal protein S9